MTAVKPSWELPDVLWEAMEPLLPVRNAYRGRPRRVDLKKVAAGVYFVMRTGIQWHALPREQFGPSSTVYYSFRQWLEAGVFVDTWAAALEAYDRNVGLDWEWQSVDGCMTKAPLGGENDGSEPDGSREIGDEAQRAYRWGWDTAGDRGGRGESAGSDIVGGNAGGDCDRPA